MMKRARRYNRLVNILAVYNLKGGVGKTTSTVNLAFLAALEGWRTLVWDLDPQGAATFCFRLKPKIQGGAKDLARGKLPLDPLIRETAYAGLDLIPADFSYRRFDSAFRKVRKPTRQLLRLLRPLEGDYDYIFLDCPPSVSLLSENVFTAADALVVPLIPTPFSMRSFGQLSAFRSERAPRKQLLLPFFCMVDARRSLHLETCWAHSKASSGFLQNRIPYSSLVEQMGTNRAPLATFAPASPAAAAYSRLWREIAERLELRDVSSKKK